MRGGKKSEKDERDEVKQTNTTHKNFEISWKDVKEDGKAALKLTVTDYIWIRTNADR